jgi:hypothetical protein
MEPKWLRAVCTRESSQTPDTPPGPRFHLRSSERNKRDFEWFKQAQPRFARGEITKEQYLAGFSPPPPRDAQSHIRAWSQVRLFTEMFYLVAWRLLEACARGDCRRADRDNAASIVRWSNFRIDMETFGRLKVRDELDQKNDRSKKDHHAAGKASYLCLPLHTNWTRVQRSQCASSFSAPNGRPCDSDLPSRSWTHSPCFGCCKYLDREPI